MSKSKVCTLCQVEKSLDDFRLDKRATLGITSRCKSCLNQQARNAYNKSPEAKQQKNKAWREANLDRHREMLRKNARENKDRAKQISKRWYENNKARKYAMHKEWKKQNQESLRITYVKRRATQKENGVYSITNSELNRILAQPCFYCKVKQSEHLDHIVPVSRGGATSIGNLIGACAYCNQSKGAKTIMEWKKNGR